MDDSFQKRIHDALGTGTPSPELSKRVRNMFQNAPSPRRWRSELLGTLAVAILGIGVGATLAFHSMVTPATGTASSGQHGLPACSPSQAELTASSERRLGTRFAFVTVTAASKGAPCFIDLPVTLSVSNLLGNPLMVNGNAAQVQLTGALPSDHPVAGLSWSNWCGSPSFKINLRSDWGSQSFGPFADAPPCATATGEVGAPSALQVATILAIPDSSPVPLNVAYPFQLYLHCGLPVIDFGASFWDLQPGQTLEPATLLSGTIARTDTEHARFSFGSKTLQLVVHQGPMLVDRQSTLCD